MFTKTAHTCHNIFSVRTPAKFAAYCAIVLCVTGCMSATSVTTVNDDLTQDKVINRANALPSVTQARAQEARAVAAQKSADAQLILDQAACAKKFLVNRCIEKATQLRHNVWDAAQINLTAARFAIRQSEANERRNNLQTKIAAYDAEHKAQAPARAANATAYAAKVKALNERIAQADKITPEQRAENVTVFEAKRNRILEIQRKRTEDNRLRVEAAQKAAQAAANAASSK